jgi:hypothetical protein
LGFAVASDAVAAFRNAQQVWAENDFPFDPGLTSRNQARAEKALRKLQP